MNLCFMWELFYFMCFVLSEFGLLDIPRCLAFLLFIAALDFFHSCRNELTNPCLRGSALFTCRLKWLATQASQVSEPYVFIHERVTRYVILTVAYKGHIDFLVAS